MNAPALGGLQVGEQLGHLEYVIDHEALAAYRAVAGSEGHYANLLADDCRALLRQRCGPLPLTAMWRGLEFMHPPIPGRRIQVGGWLRDMSDIDAAPRLRVAAFAVDEIGTEIMRSEAIFRVKERSEFDGLGATSLMNSPARNADMPAPARASFDEARSGDAIALGSVVLPDGESLDACRCLGNTLAGVDLGDDGHDLTMTLVGWFEAGIGRWFGDDFRWGGRMSLRRRRPVNAGAAVVGTAVVTERDANADGVISWRLAISAAHDLLHPAVVGDARITTPSPRTL